MSIGGAAAAADNCGSSTTGKTVRGDVRVKSFISVGAFAMRALPNQLAPALFARSCQSRNVARIDVWSYSASPWAARKTVPASIQGETTTAGTRTPYRSNANGCCGGLESGRDA